jgi:hypothetical protein
MLDAGWYTRSPGMLREKIGVQLIEVFWKLPHGGINAGARFEKSVHGELGVQKEPVCSTWDGFLDTRPRFPRDIGMRQCVLHICGDVDIDQVFL